MLLSNPHPRPNPNSQIQLDNGDLIYAPADDNRVIRAQAQG